MTLVAGAAPAPAVPYCTAQGLRACTAAVAALFGVSQGFWGGALRFWFACCQKTNLNLQPIRLSHVVLRLRSRVVY